MGSRLGVQRTKRSSSGQASAHTHKQQQPPLSTYGGYSTEAPPSSGCPQFATDADTPHLPPRTGPSAHRRTTSTPTTAGGRSSDTSTANSSSTTSCSMNPTAPAPRAPAPASRGCVPTPSSSRSASTNTAAAAPVSLRRDLVRKLSSARSLRSLDSLDSPMSSFRRFANASGGSTASSVAPENAERERIHRKRQAEKILEEIAKEYAAKRAAGLVPSIPVPARTLLWEELARNERSRVGKRGECVYGRDTDTICGCTSYKKKKIRGQLNPGGVCECCNHGGPWHRLAGGSMTQRTSQGYTRSYAGSSVRASRIGSVSRSEVPSMYSMGSEYNDDEYDDEYYDDDEYDDDDDDDDEDIASEVARPYDPYQQQQQQSYPPAYPPQQAYSPQQYQQPPHRTPYALNQFTMSAPPTADSEFDLNESADRSSMFSTSSSTLGLPTRLSSGARQLDVLLRAIQRYRQQGLSEEAIDALIAADFPPVPRRSSMRVSYASGELASM